MMKLNIQMFAEQTILNSQQSTAGSPYVIYTVKAEPSNRTANSVSIKVSVTANLKYSESTLGTGSSMGLNGYITINGTEQSAIEIKGTGTAWSGTTKHTVSKTYTITGLTASQTSLTGIKFRVARTGGGSSASGYLSSKSCSNITISSVAVPTTLNDVSITIYSDEDIYVTPYFSGGTSGYTNNLVLTVGSQTIRKTNVYSGSYEILNSSERAIIYNAIGTSTYTYLTAYIETSGLGTSSSISVRASLPSYSLNVQTFVTDLNDDAMYGGHPLSYYKPTPETVIRNVSVPMLEFRITSSTGKLYGRTISVSGATSYSGLVSGGSATINAQGSFLDSYSITASDGRKSVSSTINLSVVDYNIPKITGVLSRKESTGSEVDYKITWEYSNGDGLINLQEPSAIFRYKVNKEEQFREEKTIDISQETSGTLSGILGDFNFKDTINYELTITDKLGVVYVYNGLLTSGHPATFKYKDNDGNNYTKVYDNLIVEGDADINGKITSDNLFSYMMSTREITSAKYYYSLNGSPDTDQGITAVAHTDNFSSLTDADDYLITGKTLKNWNGRYLGSGSNLRYCARGEIASLSDIPSVPSFPNISRFDFSWGGGDGHLYLGDLQMCWGQERFSSMVANTPVYINVNFSPSFGQAPLVFVNCDTGVPGTTMKGWSATDITTSGFKLYATRSNTNSTGFQWFAIGHY